MRIDTAGRIVQQCGRPRFQSRSIGGTDGGSSGLLERSRELLEVDLTKVDARKGLIGTVAVVFAVAVVALSGLVGETAGLAVLFVLATDRPGSGRDRLVNVVVLTAAGSVIAFLAVWVGTDNALAAAVLAFVLTALTTLATARGPSVAGRALVLSIWTIFALGFNGDIRLASELALAFLLGGAFATVLLWVETRRSPAEPVEQAAEDALKSFEEVIRSPFAMVALVRATAVAIGTALGILWYPEHAIWPALTVLLVMAATPGQAFSTGLLRTFGTLLGVVLAEVVVSIADGSEVVLLAAFALSVFGMFAFNDVAFWVYVLFLTNVLILMQALVGADASTAAIDRLTATVLGAAIAFAGIGIGRWWAARPDDQPRQVH